MMMMLTTVFAILANPDDKADKCGVRNDLFPLESHRQSIADSKSNFNALSLLFHPKSRNLSNIN